MAKANAFGQPPLRWADVPTDADYQGATRYLTLLVPVDVAEATVTALRSAGVVQYAAKDLLRASRLALLPPNDPHVARDLKRVKRGQPLPPVLLVRGRSAPFDRPLIIADGYHRVCASEHVNEGEEVACQIVDLSELGSD